MSNKVEAHWEAVERSLGVKLSQSERDRGLIISMELMEEGNKYGRVRRSSMERLLLEMAGPINLEQTIWLKTYAVAELARWYIQLGHRVSLD